jgi:hypothetical protein
VLSPLLEGIGSRLTERETLGQIGPAVAFWGGGLGAWIFGNGGGDALARIETFVAERSPAVQTALLIGVVLAVAASAVLVSRFDLAVLRSLEGYWPKWAKPLSGVRVRAWRRKLDAAGEQVQSLARKGLENLTPEERAQFVASDTLRKGSPASSDLLPTRLGNVLRAAERRPWKKYRLDPVVTWPRLWLVLPDTTKQELTRARGTLDLSARASLWGALFVVWTVWAWWAAPVGLAVIVLGYRSSLVAGETYAQLVEAAFDVHRPALYRALQWPRPTTPLEERRLGEALTKYLWRGSDAAWPVFAQPEEAKGAGPEEPRS